MGVKTIIQAAVAAPHAWNSYKRWRSQLNDDGDEVDHYPGSYDPDRSSPRRPLLMNPATASTVDGDFLQQNAYSTTNYAYGATSDADDLPGFGGRVIHSSPERIRRDSTGMLHGVPEAEEDEYGDDEPAIVEEELEEEGLYKGSYSRLLFMYTLVPATALLVWVAFAALPSFAYSSKHPSTVYPYLPYFPFPLPELLTASALWCFAHLTRSPILTFLTYLLSDSPLSWLPTIISTFLHSLITIALCLASFALLQIPHATLSSHSTYHDPSFLRVWFLALGWALVEGLVAVSQGYVALASYKDVLVTLKANDDPESASITRTDGSNHGKAPQRQSPDTISNSVSLPSPVGSERRALLTKDLELQRRASNLSEEEILQMELDNDFDQLMAVKMRDELEELYGIPYVKIPVFLTCLQRLNSVLLALGVFLLSSAAYLRSPLSTPAITPSVISPYATPSETSPSYTSIWETTKSNQSLFITIPLLLFIHTSLATLHTPLVLPRIGVHTVVYAGLLISLGSFFAGLGVWEALS